MAIVEQMKNLTKLQQLEKNHAALRDQKFAMLIERLEPNSRKIESLAAELDDTQAQQRLILQDLQRLNGMLEQSYAQVVEAQAEAETEHDLDSRRNGNGKR